MHSSKQVYIYNMHSGRKVFVAATFEGLQVVSLETEERNL